MPRLLMGALGWGISMGELVVIVVGLVAVALVAVCVAVVVIALWHKHVPDVKAGSFHLRFRPRG